MKTKQPKLIMEWRQVLNGQEVWIKRYAPSVPCIRLHVTEMKRWRSLAQRTSYVQGI